MSIIEVLQEWYKNICESSICTGIQIETVNNCGWCVYIDLFDTAYETESFDTVYIQKSGSDWFKCIKENSLFKGYGGVQNLEDILNAFYCWIKTEKA
ncbi:Imm53 family immunity protein [Clostridium sp. Mt-5]|uniref:Imm53 family immunity protein n=1 Tax=Clostridium moutaii TaxID=3240932 RepID=A0ABV4BUR1_9CLOT